MNDIVGMDGKAISTPIKKSRQKTGQDAKRWKKLFNLLDNGIISLISAGNTLSRDEVRKLVETLDEMIDEDAVELKRLAAKKRRDNAKK